LQPEPVGQPARLAGRNLDHRAGEAAAQHAPRPDAVLDVDRERVVVHEHDVDLEAHPEGVNGGAVRDDERLVEVEAW